MSNTGYKNIYHNKRDCGKPFVVICRIRGKAKNIGYFATLEDAIFVAAKLPLPDFKSRNKRNRNNVTGRFSKGKIDAHD